MTDAIKKLPLFAAFPSEEIDVVLIKEANHVYRIQSPAGIFFLKTYTKEWYPSDPAKTNLCVEHEASAFRLLARHGLAAPEIAFADSSCANALQRPFLLTKSLAGQSFTELLKTADPEDFAELNAAVGRYLGKMHAIKFKYPGYLYGDGPTEPPDPNEWQHMTWTYEANEKYADAFRANDRKDGLDELVDRALAYIRTQESALRASFADPRFISADCHAHQLFLKKISGNWEVTGIVDMETASAGERGGDLVKLTLEMAGIFSAKTRWWIPLLESYDETYDFHLHKARMLLAGPENYWCTAWPGDRRTILTHLLKAESWEVIFDLEKMRAP